MSITYEDYPTHPLSAFTTELEFEFREVDKGALDNYNE